ncbi:HD domain-containing protein [Iocasia frigidifontis]|uniref:HD domain-containing protein n=1 Tax=Iocasia fonsfrigidae TaxID=2682810 RepID=A0A8A7KE20_9FIRM|nr:HD-GYP domain-containing protein [Iocasia fonsfrigidae]QTL99510.1 HD domain-containing protein [Iocasia fonsfrigidae]
MGTIVKLGVYELKAGMRVAKFIENDFGAVLVSPGMILDENIIAKLQVMGIKQVAVIDESEEQVEENINSFAVKYQENINELKETFDSIKHGNKLEFEQLREIVNISSQIDTNRDIINMLSQVRSVDEYTYTHSVNVGLLAMIFGRWIDLGQKEIKGLLYAGLLHDIGKSKVPDKILNKKGQLSNEEFEEIKKHVIYGYELVQDCSLLSNKIAKAVLLHHERNDGSGYPLGLSREKIPFMAKILAIVDTFDAITSDRVYRQHQPPFAVFKIFERDFQGFDYLLTKIFMSNISQYYMGETIKLSDGRSAEIVYINPNHWSKPIVKIDKHYIDLSKETDLEIADVMMDSV